jgi:molybdopterin converting factor small subunit
MVAKIIVQFFGAFQRLSGKKRYQVKLQEPVTVREVIMKLAETFPPEFSQVLLTSKLDDPRPNSLILVGGKEISALQGLETMVKDSEEIILIPVAHGG